MRKGTVCVCPHDIFKGSTTNLAKLVPLKLASKLVEGCEMKTKGLLLRHVRGPKTLAKIVPKKQKNTKEMGHEQ